MLRKRSMLRLLTGLLFLYSTFVFCVAETQMLPITKAPVSLSEQMLHGNVIRMIETVELPTQENNKPDVKCSYSRVWKKVKIVDSVVAASPGMTFLIPEMVSFKDIRPYFFGTDRPGKKDICFLFPLDKEVPMQWQVTRYDSQGRIIAMHWFDIFSMFSSKDSCFRYEFHYADENDMNYSNIKVFFFNPNSQIEEEIGYINLQYENSRLVRYLSGGAGYFFSDKKVEFAYGDHGFLSSEATYNGHDASKLAYVFRYSNYEQDRHGNWISRDVYLDEQLRRKEKRKICYADELLAGDAVE